MSMQNSDAGCSLHAVLEALEPRLLLSGSLEQQAMELFGISPALFAENRGQWADESIRYVYNGNSANVAVTDSGVLFQVFRRVEDEAAESSVLLRK